MKTTYLTDEQRQANEARVAGLSAKPTRRKVTNKTRSWVFRQAWKHGKANLAGWLKHYWRKARLAAGIITPSFADIGATGMNNTGCVYSLKAMAAGNLVRMNRASSFESHAM